MALQEQFALFSKFGDSKSDGKSVTLTQIDKWMKQAGVIDGKKITTTDTGICFNKFKTKTMNFTDYQKFIEELAKYKSADADKIREKLANCGQPGLQNVTQTVKAGAVDRLTDTSKYTGSHKERFDESGKGKGLEGRVDIADDAGYVSGYKEKDTYDKTHPK